MTTYQSADAAARVMLRAWEDPAFRAGLLNSPRETLALMSIEYDPNVTLEVRDNGGAGFLRLLSFVPGFREAALLEHA